MQMLYCCYFIHYSLFAHADTIKARIYCYPCVYETISDWFCHKLTIVRNYSVYYRSRIK